MTRLPNALSRPSTRPAAGLLLACVALALGACAPMGISKPSVATVDVAEPTSARPVAAVVPAVGNGAIFQAAAYRPLFEDHRARLVGDTLTVQIVEKVTASANSTSSVEKTGEVKGGITGFPFLSTPLLGKLGVGGSSSNVFSGKGGTENTNKFEGTITCTVVEVLSNGHLIVAGEKQIGVNENVDVLRFTGQVDPRAIQPGNSVASAQIANVRVEQRGRGQQADAQGLGWLSRFFLNLSPV
jgi:flagellar L-ring protein precursor FlgH